MVHEMIVHKQYFDWMSRLVSDRRYTRGRSYQELLAMLDQQDFTWILPMDQNREWDGLDLRDRFARETGTDISDLFIDPCSVLEMMIALSLRCEEDIMSDTDLGDRTGKWFWDMIESLGLSEMDDERLDENLVSETLYRLLQREYEPDGHGGLFTVDLPDADMRDIEIWYQMMWYLDKNLPGGTKP